MSQVLQMPAASDERERHFRGRARASVCPETTSVLFASIEDTLAAVRAARRIAGRIGVPVTVLHFRTVPFALPVDQPTGVSPVETDAFVARLRAEGLNARVQVYLCRDERQAIPLAFKPHSLIVMADQDHWWPTPSDRRRRSLQAAGHLVISVDPTTHQEASHA